MIPQKTNLGDEILIEEIFKNFRQKQQTIITQRKELIQFLVINNLSVQNLVRIIIDSDKTGWKEVVSTIRYLTGIELNQLNITIYEKGKLEEFCRNPMLSNSDWMDSFKKVQVEFADAKMNLALAGS
jgi:hypothetical protein